MSFDSHHWSAPMTYFNSLVMYSPPHIYSFFFFNDTATTEIYTLSLHDALPILASERARQMRVLAAGLAAERRGEENRIRDRRSEEHTSELQSPDHLVCRLLLEKKKTKKVDKRFHTSRRPVGRRTRRHAASRALL